MRYHPLYEGLWSSRRLEGAPFEEKGFFAYLFSNDHVRPSGIYRATDAELAAGTELPLRKVMTYLADLQARGRIVRDGAWIFVAGYFERQPKQERLLLGVQSDISECDSAPILTAWGQRYQHYSKWSTDRLVTVTNPLNDFVRTEQSSYRAYTEQSRAEQGTVTNPSATPLAADAAPPPQLDIPAKILERVPSLARWPTTEALVDLWNDHAQRHGYPRVESISPARRTKSKLALRQFPDWRFWNGAFSHVKASRFLSGLVPPTNGHSKAFRADFDWFLAKGKDGTENVVKVSEGSYNDQEHQEHRT